MFPVLIVSCAKKWPVSGSALDKRKIDKKEKAKDQT